ncbi:MAG: ABC transporter substrate-binding protein, partial [Ferrovibrionaceae bacterium]
AAPTGFKDWLDPKHGNKIGFIDIQYQSIMIAASLAGTNGASMNDLDKAKEVLMAVKKAGARVYPTNEAFAAAMKNEEIGISAIWKARVVQWQNAGIPVEIADPKEGIVLYISEMVMAKNAKNKDNAYAYLNALMDTVPQFQFARAMGYNPTVDNVTLPKEISERINFPADVQAKFMLQDQEYLAKNDAQLREWWDKVFKA